MTESIPAETLRLSALETKSVTRKTHRPSANSATGAACRRTHGVHEPPILRLPPGLERQDIVGKCPLLLSDPPAAGRDPADSGLPSSRRLEEGITKLLEADAPGGSLERTSCGNMQDRWYACSCAPHCYVRSISPTGRNPLSLQPSSLPAPAESGVRNQLIRLFLQKYHINTTGDADDTISLDSKQCLWMEPIFERLHRRQPQDKPLLTMNYAEYLLLFRRARANLQIDVVPCQGRHFGASVDRAKNSQTLQSIQKPGRWKSAKFVCRYEKNGRVNQSWSERAPLVQAHCEHCKKLLTSVLLHGHASPTPPRLLRF